MKNYYSLLGLESNATKTEIKKNYRSLASKFHPDVNPDPDAPTKFIAINEAYEVLSNKKTRAQYDLLRWEAAKQKTQAKDVEDYFSVFRPPKVSLRTKRNNAQKERSTKYHKSQSNSLLSLLFEGLVILSRHGLHFLGVFFSIFILKVSFKQLLTTIGGSGKTTIILSFFIAILFFALYKILQNFFIELGKDIDAFSVFYKLSRFKAKSIVWSVMLPLLLILAMILKSA